jgi:ElaA protein
MLALRQRVFIVEQHCAYQDADGRDAGARHLLGWDGARAEAPLLACARVFPPGVRYAEASIGRIATAPEVRGRGYGRLLTQEAIRRCAELFPGAAIRLGAQRRLEEFYRELGFVTASEPYDEDGIEHVEMVRAAASHR